MIIGKYFEDRLDYEELTCSDGAVFRVDYAKVYRDAINHERDYCNAQLAKYVDVVYDILKDTNENPEEECSSVSEYIDKKMSYGDQRILYIMKPKENIDQSEVFNACRAWYDYLLASMCGNHMTKRIPSSADRMARYEHILVPNRQSTTTKAYVIKGSVNEGDGTSALWLTTLENMQQFSDDALREYKNKLDALNRINNLLKNVEDD